MGYFSPVIRKYLFEYAGSLKGRLLDVGCGTSPHRSLFASASQYIGLDRPSAPYAAYSQNSERKQAINVIGSAYEIPFRSSCFDAVLAFQVLEHMAEPLAFLIESKRVLRNGGEILLTFPLINPVHEAPYDFFRYTHYGLRHLCEIADLEILQLTPMGGGWMTVGYLLRSLMLWNEQIDKPHWWRKRFAHFIYNMFARYDSNHPCPEWTLNYFSILRKN